MNRAPEPEAGDDRVVAVGKQVTLDASGSSDPDGDDLAYQWRIETSPMGASAGLSRAGNVSARLTPDVVGTWELFVEVSDGTKSASTSVSLNVRGKPTAEAGPGQVGEVGQQVTLDGTASSTPSGAKLQYRWVFVRRPDASGATLQGAGNETVTFTPDEPGTYLVELTVDNQASESSDRVTIEVSPEGGRLTSTVYVSPQGSDDNRGTEDKPLKTVSAALTLAHDQQMVSRIELAEGTYALGETTEEITKELDIAGPSAGDKSALIEGASGIFDIKGTAFVTLLDVTLETDATAVSVGDEAGVSIVGVTCRAHTCLASGSLFGDNGGRLEVKQSTFVGKGETPGEGISSTAPDDISVTNTTIEGFDEEGIHVLNGALSLRNCTIRENGKGVLLVVNSSAKATLIKGTDFRQNQVAVRSEGARNITLESSTVEHSKKKGVLINGGAVQFRKTRVEAVLGHGVIVDSDAVATFRDTELLNNLEDGLRIKGRQARVDLGTANQNGGNRLEYNIQHQVHDVRADGAGGKVTLSDTIVGSGQPPAGTYSGPGFDKHGIVIDGANDVVVY